MSTPPKHTGTTKSLAIRANRRKRRPLASSSVGLSEDSDLSFATKLNGTMSSEDNHLSYASDSIDLNPFRSVSDDTDMNMNMNMNGLNVEAEFLPKSNGCLYSGSSIHEKIDEQLLHSDSSNDTCDDFDLREDGQTEPVEEAHGRDEGNTLTIDGDEDTNKEMTSINCNETKSSPIVTECSSDLEEHNNEIPSSINAGQSIHMECADTAKDEKRANSIKGNEFDHPSPADNEMQAKLDEQVNSSQKLTFPIEEEDENDFINYRNDPNEIEHGGDSPNRSGFVEGLDNQLSFKIAVPDDHTNGDRKVEQNNVIELGETEISPLPPQSLSQEEEQDDSSPCTSSEISHDTEIEHGGDSPHRIGSVEGLDNLLSFKIAVPDDHTNGDRNVHQNNVIEFGETEISPLAPQSQEEEQDDSSPCISSEISHDTEILTPNETTEESTVRIEESAVNQVNDCISKNHRDGATCEENHQHMPLENDTSALEDLEIFPQPLDDSLPCISMSKVSPDDSENDSTEQIANAEENETTKVNDECCDDEIEENNLDVSFVSEASGDDNYFKNTLPPPAPMYSRESSPQLRHSDQDVDNIEKEAIVESNSSEDGVVCEENSTLSPLHLPRSPQTQMSPINSKMAEKIAMASSRAEKKFNDLMNSFSSASGDNDLTGVQSSPSIGEGELVRGAFTPVSNSTNACISPTGGSKDGDECMTSSLDLDLTSFSKRLESSLTAAVEVQLSPRPKSFLTKTSSLLQWLRCILIDEEPGSRTSPNDSLESMKELLNNSGKINSLCQYVTNSVNASTKPFDEHNSKERCDYYGRDIVHDDVSAGSKSTIEGAALALLRRNDQLQPFQIITEESPSRKSMLSVQFSAFVMRIGYLSGFSCPVKGSPFLSDAMERPVMKEGNSENNEFKKTLQEGIFGSDDRFVEIIEFFQKVTNPDDSQEVSSNYSQPEHDIIYDQTFSSDSGLNPIEDACLTPKPPLSEYKKVECLTDKRGNRTRTSVAPIVSDKWRIPPPNFSRYYKIPETSPCPFEISIWNVPSIVLIVLGCLGDPVIACRMKMVNKFCNRIIHENEYVIMKDSVRLGGMAVHVRPAFWMWITLERCADLDVETKVGDDRAEEGENDHETPDEPPFNFRELEEKGRESKWHHIIERDVIRAFGNFPPHKANGSRRNSIVRALVTWGQNHLLRRDDDGTCRVVPTSCDSENPIRRLTISPPSHRVRDKFDSPADLIRSETVSDWGGISPVGSNISSVGSLTRTNSLELVLNGNELTQEMKADLQKKLGSILDVIAAVHEGFGYCQGRSVSMQLGWFAKMTTSY